MNYTAEDGLKVLDYLGLKITEPEIKVFREIMGSALFSEKRFYWSNMDFIYRGLTFFVW